ncbi:MAG: type II secretion system pilot lipoprotein GspS-beta [Plesiomonas shigelloides]
MKLVTALAALGIVLSLTGCAMNQSDAQAEQLAEQQVNRLRNYLPMQGNGYTLVMASKLASEIKLVFVQDNQNNNGPQQTPAAFLDAYRTRMCADSAIRLILNQGVTYQISVNTLQQQTPAQLRLTKENCQ